MSTILITGARAPIARDLARSFEAAGHLAHLADSILPWGAALTTPRERLHRLASPRFAFRQFAVALRQLVERLDPALIVPTCEEVFYVAEAASLNGFAHRVFAPPLSMLRRLHSKVDFAVLAHSVGITAPQTTRINSRDELDEWRPRCKELVFKPEFSRFASHTLIRPAASALEAVSPSKDEPWAVQVFAPGEEVCVWSAVIAGNVVAFAAYKPNWRLGRSASFYFEADRDPALLEMTRTLARAANVTGQLSFDVIRGVDGGLSPIECNPRGVSGIHLFDADARLARAFLGQEDDVQLPDVDARHLAPAMWLLGAPMALASGRFPAFCSDLARSRDALVGVRGSLGALLDAARFGMVGINRGRSASGQSTDDIEWNGGPIE